MKYKIGDKFLNELEVTEIEQEKSAPYFLSGGQSVGWWSEAALADLRKYITVGWIPVSERLPEEPECGIVDMDSLKEYIVMIAYASFPTFLMYAGDGEWYRDGDYYKVVAWMPLPEPYRSGN